VKTTVSGASVATRIAETMYAYGVRFAFGIPGNDVLELIRACEQTGIRFLLAKSEPSAGFMADAVSQVTGKPAACIFALGPGVANGATGVAGALMERSPVIVLGGEMASDRRGLYTHQVFDHVGFMKPVTKWAAELNPARAAQQTAKALDIALTHPQGPVYLNCAADASRAAASEPAPRLPAPHKLGQADAQTLAEVAEGLSKAKQPLALIGRAALQEGVAQPLAEFLDAWNIPYLSTFKAKGLASERNDLSLGALGLSPIVDGVTQELVDEADHLVLVGFDAIELRDAWLDAWGEDRACVTLDWVTQTDRVYPSGKQLIGDVTANLAALAAQARSAAAWPESRIETYRAKVAEIVAPRTPETGVSPAALYAEIDKSIDDTMWLTVDVGAHRILACHALNCVTPGQLIQHNGLCSMGYAIPAAAGAALADPGKRVVAMLGDGCALMSLGELAVIAEHNLPVTVIVLNDSSLALIELKQSKMQVETGAVRFKSPNFAELAKGFGMESARATTNAEFASAYEKSRKAKGPFVIEAVCDASEYWEQM
jgi:acetolactate synthase-1/2/3 large subunit